MMKERTKVWYRGVIRDVMPGTWGAKTYKLESTGIRGYPSVMLAASGRRQEEWVLLETLEKENPTPDSDPEWGEFSA